MWVDECGVHISMTRLRARAPRGERAFGSVPRNRDKNTVLMGSMTLEGAMGEAVAVEDFRIVELQTYLPPEAEFPT